MSDFTIYDALISEIPDNLTVNTVVSGHTWTVVKNSEGDLGMAMTTMGDTRPRSSMSYNGMKLRDVAELAKSWNFIEASVGMAAINSYYNTGKRMTVCGYEQPDKRFCTFDIDIKDKNVCMVGHLRHNGEVFEEVKNLYILDMNAHDGDYPATACEFIIPECQVLIITGSAFVNKSITRLLELGKNAYTIVTGPSTPMAPQILNGFGINRLCGFIPRDKDTILQFISAGCMKPPYQYGWRFYIE